MKPGLFARVTLIMIVLGAGWGIYQLIEPASTGTPTVLHPVGDAYVHSARPERNFGNSSALRADGSPQMLSYMRFDLRNIAEFDEARLQFYAASSHRAGVNFYLTDGSWQESSVTYANGPGPSFGPIGSSGRLTRGRWFSIDVTNVARPGMVLNLIMMTDSKTQVKLASRESGSKAPRLTLSGALETPTPEPPTATATDMPPAVPTSTPTPTNTPGDPTPTFTSTPTSTPIPTPTVVPNTPTPTPTSTPPPGDGGDSLSFPIRAAFYYPWFPEAWDQGGTVPFTQFEPTLGQYSTGDASTIRQHISWMQYAQIEAGIASWWGPGHHTDDDLRRILDATDGTGFKWSIYHELEGYSRPSGAQIRDDLSYIRDNLATDSDYLRIDGRFVVFVYNADDLDCDVAGRWMEAATEFDVFVVLKVFSGYGDCQSQPDSWHQYGPATASDHQRGYSYTISPGFWHANDGNARLERDLDRWQRDVQNMVASGEPWQLVTTFNEWGEGTSVEPASEWGMNYLDVLANDGAGSKPDPPTPTPTIEPTPAPTADPTPTPGQGGSVTLTFAGDLGGNSDSQATLGTINAIGPTGHFLMGDVSYSEISPESAWCDWVNNQTNVPIELVVGNHEEDGGPDGFIRNFTACMPDRLGAVGDYGVQYYVDLPNVRVVAISPDLSVDGHHYGYNPGDTDRQWLEAAINGARASGRWVIVIQHKVCISAGSKPCEIGGELANYLLANADLIFMGHQHNYQRSYLLTCVEDGNVVAACIADTDSDHQQGDGAVYIINGAGGRDSSIDYGNPDAGYFAALMGEGDPGWGHGVVRVDISANQITGTFISSTGTYADAFVMRR